MTFHLKTLLLQVIAVLLGILSLSAQAQGVAMALDRAGDVEVASATKSGRLNVLDYLAPDAELRLPTASSATVVYLATSQEWQFAGPGRYKLQAGQPVVLQGAAPKARGLPAPSTQAIAKMEPTQRERMALGAVVMRSGGPVRIVSPNNVDVASTRPTLLWQTTENNPVRISVLAAGASTPLAQTVTQAMQWTLPEELAPGDYSWRTEVASDTPGPARSGRFRIIGSDDERRGRLGGQVPGEFAQRVARAMMLESEDLPHDALLIWRTLAAERPDEEALRKWAR